jgi:hypothetical protein
MESASRSRAGLRPCKQGDFFAEEELRQRIYEEEAWVMDGRRSRRFGSTEIGEFGVTPSLFAAAKAKTKGLTPAGVRDWGHTFALWP